MYEHGTVMNSATREQRCKVYERMVSSILARGIGYADVAEFLGGRMRRDNWVDRLGLRCEDMCVAVRPVSGGGTRRRDAPLDAGAGAPSQETTTSQRPTMMLIFF